MQLTNYMFNKVLEWNDQFKDLTNSVIIFSNNNSKILTDTGWSDFNGIVKFQNKQVKTYQVNGKKVICTADHKFMKGDKFIPANEFKCLGNQNKTTVFDVINVQKNNRFIVNDSIVAHNCLICDEFAFLKQSLQAQFLQSVFPVVSSSKTSKIILVSTPNGMGNQFYRTWNRATLKLNQDTKYKNLNWQTVKIDWWEVPGRDQKWKKLQLESFNGDENKFLQEYGNSFLGSAETLINPEKIKKVKQQFSKSSLQSHDIQLHKYYQNTKIKLYQAPIKNHAYLIGADPSMGTQSDYHSMIIFDITNTYQIKQVAGFYQNNVPPKIFAYILAKSAMLYNNAFISIENNGCSQVVLDALWRDFQYDNLINQGGNIKTNIGIHSSNELKTIACVFIKSLIQDQSRNIMFNDGRLIAQMQKFERKSRPGKMPSYCAADGHDDYMMAVVWGLYALTPDIIQRYYQIKKYNVNKLGQQIPLHIAPYYSNIDDKTSEIKQLDQRLQLLNHDAISQSNNQLDIKNFIQNNNLEIIERQNQYQKYKNQPEQDPDIDRFHFGGFV